MRPLLSACAVLVLAQSMAAADLQRHLPNPIEYQRWMQKHQRPALDPKLRRAVAERAALSGTGKILVILVEFGGPDTFEFIPSGANASTWDPLGKVDESEWTGKAGDCSEIVRANNITGPTRYTYNGPLHNQIARPLSETDMTGWRIWTPDFTAQYYRDLIFGNGVKYDYARQDGSRFQSDLTGTSVLSYYRDLSNGAYSVAGDVIGWVKVAHSIWWYGADPCPGRVSTPHLEVSYDGGIPNTGTVKTLVVDAVEAVKAQQPGFDWAPYDANHDGVVDNLWVVVAGISESDKYMLSRTSYGEGGIWDHASSVTPAHSVAPGIKVGPYLMVTESSGVSVLAHEYGHTLGAIDLYSEHGGTASPGFWSLMSDTWVGYPTEAQPVALDPYHLDAWGWLEPLVITNPAQDYNVKVGQASQFPGSSGLHRAIKIPLPDGRLTLPVAPLGGNQWWGGAEDLTNAMMTLAKPVALPGSGSITLSFQTAYQTEQEWDFLWVQISTDGGAQWKTLTNTHTVCKHDPGWIGGGFGFPEDLCAEGIGGFTGESEAWPAYARESFDLTPFAGSSILLRFWYMTDWNAVMYGPYVDNIAIAAGSQTVFSDGVEAGDSNWVYSGTWERNAGVRLYSHAYYLQWRNVAQGLDAGLSNPGYRFAPANSGLVVWYENGRYTDNEIYRYLLDPPSFGPKGRMLVLDAHPEPYRDPTRLSQGFNNEGANLESRSLMRDAPFSQHNTSPFTLKAYTTNDVTRDETFAGRPAVRTFSDARGYYPGAELVRPGPGDSVSRWVTQQWDASAVVPSRVPYGIKAPGFHAGDELLFNCEADTGAGKLNCDALGLEGRVNMDGGSGNPGDSGGEYGWNVEVVSQSATEATLHIWNTRGGALPGISAVTNAFGGSSTIAPNTWVVITGSNLAPAARTWQGSDFAGNRMPTALDGVRVTMNGLEAFVYYISATQLNVLTPPDLGPGPVKVIVEQDGVASAPRTTQAAEYAPSFFVIGGTPYVLAVHANGALIGPADLYPGHTTPARPGETIVLYVNGCGETDVPIVSGSPVQSGTLPETPEVRIGGQKAVVTFAGLASPGLYQFNVVVPEGTPSGENTVTATYEGFATQAGVVLAVAP